MMHTYTIAVISYYSSHKIKEKSIKIVLCERSCKKQGEIT